LLLFILIKNRIPSPYKPYTFIQVQMTGEIRGKKKTTGQLLALQLLVFVGLA
jgi:hypothetical protein